MADRIGHHPSNYRLVHLLGQGVLAEVYLGEHIHLGTQAAIKLFHMQLAGKDADSFCREARSIARLKHPHIARVFDFGIEGETPFLVMDYAPNGTVRKRHPKGGGLPLPTILNYVKQVADALQYVHDEHFIHCDIKPENLLVGRRQEILLSDFGIALIAQTSRSHSMQDVAGTASYMAPEQFQGKPRSASDQYALAVMVYEWLTGTCPFHGSFPEIASQHLFVPPPPFRSRYSTISPAVEQVVMTALAKDPYQRFGSVQAFATAFEQASQVEMSQTFPGSSSISTKRSTPQSQTSITTVPSVLLGQTGVPTALPSEVALPARPSRVPPVEMSRAAPSQQGISRRMVVVGLAGLAVVGVIGGDFLWLARSQQSATTSTLGATLYTYRGHSDQVHSVEWSLDGRRIASGSFDGTVQVWDANNEGHRYTYRGHSGAVFAVAWSPDGKRIASGSGHVQVWDAADGGNVFIYSGQTYYIEAVEWSPDGKRIASGGGDVQVWNAADGSHAFTYSGHSALVNAVAWSPDGRRIASGSEDKTVQVWNAADGGNVFIYRGHSDLVNAVAWSPDGRRIASGGGHVQVWDAADGSHVYTYRGHSDLVNAVEWSPDGRRIAFVGILILYGPWRGRPMGSASPRGALIRQCRCGMQSERSGYPGEWDSFQG